MDAILVELLAEIILRQAALGKDAIHVYMICSFIRHQGGTSCAILQAGV